MTSLIDQFKYRVQKLKREVYTIYFAYKDPRVPWYAKVFIACIVAYAFSPIDLIPDFIPILGYIDDLLLIPIGITIAIKMIPKIVFEEAQERARDTIEKPVSWIGAIIIVFMWLFTIILVVKFVSR